jgi:hypothetical protein
MRIYVEAYRADGEQILGSQDGQRAWNGIAYRRTDWYQSLSTFRTLDGRVAYYRIVNDRGDVLETVRNLTHEFPRDPLTLPIGIIYRRDPVVMRDRPGDCMVRLPGGWMVGSLVSLMTCGFAPDPALVEA